MRSPLGKNEIGKFLPTAAKNAGLQGRITNHSVRKTCISLLLDADVPDNFVAQLSGHRSLKSLDAKGWFTLATESEAESESEAEEALRSSVNQK